MSIAEQRQEIQKNHETDVVEAFAKFLRNNGRNVNVLTRPDEPSFGDGLLIIDHHEQWLEILDVHTRENEARQIWKSITPEEKAEPQKLSVKDSMNPRNFHEVLIDNIKKKLNKPGYRDAVRKWGSGILICVCQDDTVNYDWDMEKEFVENEFTGASLEQLCKMNDRVFKYI